MVFLALFLFPTPPIFAREDSSQKKEAPPGSPVCDTYQYEQVWLFKRRVVHVSYKMVKNIKITTCKTDNHSVHAYSQTLLQEHKISASYWGLFSELLSFIVHVANWLFWMSSRLVVRHSGCFWEENLLNVAILHLGLLSLSLHQTSVNNVFLFSLSRWGISSRNRYAMQKLTTVSNPISLTKKLKSDSQWWVILWSARRWRYKEICVLDSAQTHIVGHVKHVKILRNAAAYW